MRSSQADAIVRRPPGHFVFWLIFGPDHGLVSERVDALIEASSVDRQDPFLFVRLQGDAIAADPLKLLDEANAIPLFGGSRLILIEAGGKSFVPSLERLLAAPPKDCQIVIEAGALKRDAPLRKLLEREKNAAALECAPDSPEEIEHLIRASVTQAGLRIDDDARRALAAMLGADRLSSRGEIEKLLLYAHGQSDIRLADVEAAIADASGVVVDAAISAAFSGELEAADEASHRVYATGGDPNYLLAMVLRQAVGLHRAKLAQDSGGDARFFGLAGHPRQIEAALKRWRAPDLERAIAWTSEAIALVRRAPGTAEASAVRVLWRIARVGRPN